MSPTTISWIRSSFIRFPVAKSSSASATRHAGRQVDLEFRRLPFAQEHPLFLDKLHHHQRGLLMSVDGTNRTNRAGLTMSVDRVHCGLKSDIAPTPKSVKNALVAH